MSVSGSNEKLSLEFCDRDLVYRDGQNELWRLSVDYLVVVGEYTNAGGPWFDDWFLIFGYRQEGKMEFREIPVPLDVKEVLAELGNRLEGEPIRPQLVSSTEWNSRVLWPETLEGKPFFNFANKSPQVNPEILQL